MQRVAVRPVAQPPGAPGGERRDPQRPRELPQLVLVEARHAHDGTVVTRDDPAQALRQLGDGVVAHREQHQHLVGHEPAQREDEGAHGRLVRPVQVVDDEQHRSPPTPAHRAARAAGSRRGTAPRRGAPTPRPGPPPPSPRSAPAGRGPRRRAASPPPRRSPEGPWVPVPRLRSMVGSRARSDPHSPARCDAPAPFAPGWSAPGPGPLLTRRRSLRCSRALRLREKPLDQRRLADPRRPLDLDDPRPPRTGVGEPGTQDVELSGATDERVHANPRSLDGVMSSAGAAPAPWTATLLPHGCRGTDCRGPGGTRRR